MHYTLASCMCVDCLVNCVNDSSNDSIISLIYTYLHDLVLYVNIEKIIYQIEKYGNSLKTHTYFFLEPYTCANQPMHYNYIPISIINSTAKIEPLCTTNNMLDAVGCRTNLTMSE